jgi:hypothetical protein
MVRAEMLQASDKVRAQFSSVRKSVKKGLEPEAEE